MSCLQLETKPLSKHKKVVDDSEYNRKYSHHHFKLGSYISIIMKFNSTISHT